jgi:hypothetical protein
MLWLRWRIFLVNLGFAVLSGRSSASGDGSGFDASVNDEVNNG